MLESNAKKILVVEDNPALCRVVCYNLQRAGYVVVAACNGREATEALPGQHFDLVVTDQQMPEMNGWEFAQRLRQDPTHLDTPLFFLTAKGLELDRNRLRDEVGATAVFSKPFSPSELVRAVDRLFAAAPPVAPAT